MSFFATAYSDKGIMKHTNQDSVLLKVAETSGGSLCLAVVCDGMGGHDKGELASATVVRAFEAWFNNSLPERIGDQDLSMIKAQWIDLVERENYKIREYGRQSAITIGTTLTAVLFFRGMYLLIHIGDSRLSRIQASHNGVLEVLTNDQTVAARDIARGVLTPQEAISDPRRHVLLQCIGASPALTPQISMGQYMENELFVLCTDGFCYMVSWQEICSSLHPLSLQNEQEMLQRSIRLVNLCMERQESDNITVVLIKTV